MGACCDGHGWVHADDGVHPCPSCRPKEYARWASPPDEQHTEPLPFRPDWNLIRKDLA